MRTSTLYFLVPIMLLIQPARAQLVLNEVMALNTSGAYKTPALRNGGKLSCGLVRENYRSRY